MLISFLKILDTGFSGNGQSTNIKDITAVLKNEKTGLC